MASITPSARAVAGRQPFRAIFLPFPIASFTLALFTDVAFWRTSHIMWQNFSSWLLLAGLVFGGLAVVAGIVDLFTGRLGGPMGWPLAIGGAVVLVLAFLNSLVHAGDGWTAVVPYGLILSAATVVIIALTYWLCRAAAYRYYIEGGVRDVA